MPNQQVQDDRSILQQLLDRMERIETMIRAQRQLRDYYSVSEAAKGLDRAEFTVREWCRLGRINAEKKRSGRGHASEWVISHEELLRIQKEGLLPLHENRS